MKQEINNWVACFISNESYRIILTFKGRKKNEIKKRNRNHHEI